MPETGQSLYNPAGGQRITFTSLPGDKHKDTLVMMSVYDPHSLRPPMHYHPAQEEKFEVLEGELTVVRNGRSEKFQGGQSFEVPACMHHAMWNEGEEEVRIRWTVKPALDTPQFMEKIYTLAEAGNLNAKGSPAFLQSVLLMQYYGHVFRPSGIPHPLLRVLVFLLSPLARMAGYSYHV